ncbi:pancreatic lipase-related protein 2 [Elysia marginata]|uniref:Pancreatic lipase-related protein 2 n=1 Tax=Elysia marginata TaxID=1093978 RepID=A0AAV4HSB9_9GAST|nr:pancreatic lipase-related protein 2 [Elysia marginata]
MEVLVDVSGIDPMAIQLLGISMGVHVAGQASRQFRIGRITALDPSGPFYELLPRFLRLDTTDADFVEAVHSSLFFGSVNPYVGHVNYMINDALTQAGCPAETGKFHEVFQFTHSHPDRIYCIVPF